MGDYYEHDLLQGICMEIMGPFQCEYEDERDKKKQIKTMTMKTKIVFLLFNKKLLKSLKISAIRKVDF